MYTLRPDKKSTNRLTKALAAIGIVTVACAALVFVFMFAGSGLTDPVSAATLLGRPSLAGITTQMPVAPAATANPPPASTPTVAPLGTTVTITLNANLRSGPGTEFEIVGGAQAGETLVAAGRNPDGTWLLLDGDMWIAAFLVTGPIDGLPVAPALAGSQPAMTLNAPALPTVTPTLQADLPAVQEHTFAMQAYTAVCDGVLEDLCSLFIEAGESP